MAHRSYHVVFVGSASVLPMNKLIDRPGAPATYPGIEQDYEKTFQVLRSLPCDVFLAWRTDRLFAVDKRGVMAKKPAQNPFIDPWGYQAYILRAEGVFQERIGGGARSRLGRRSPHWRSEFGNVTRRLSSRRRDVLFILRITDGGRIGISAGACGRPIVAIALARRRQQLPHIRAAPSRSQACRSRARAPTRDFGCDSLHT